MPNYAFIDSQNLNLGVQAAGWQLDYAKFRHYLHEKYGVTHAYLFIGYRRGHQKLYTSLKRKGYRLVFKPTIVQPDGTIKGNVDAELVLHAMLTYDRYDQAVIVSGDGDFYCLANYLAKQGKLLRIMTPNERFSTLLRRFFPYIIRIDRQRAILEYKPQIKRSGPGGRSKP